jgi:SAM-dependent methyltransferase
MRKGKGIRTALSAAASLCFLLGQLVAQVPSGSTDRDSWQQPEKVMDVIGVKAGMTIGEVGAGNGYFTFKLARRVGPSGLVYANDIDPDGLRSIAAGARQRKIGNIVTVRGEVDDPLFPPGVMDLAIMVYVLHELARPVELLRNLKPSLKPGATLVILDRDPDKVHSSGERFYHKDEILELAGEAGFEVVSIETFLPRDNFYILRDRDPKSPSAGAAAVSPADNEEKALPAVSRYDLNFKLLLKENKLEAVSQMEIRNGSRDSVSELPFLLYRLFDVLAVTDGEGAALPFNQLVVKFSDERSLQANLALVRLDRPIGPGKTITIRLKYEGSLWGYPEVMAYVRDRIDENYSLLRPDSLAYPMLAGPSFRSLLEAYRSSFTFRVEAEVPAGYVVACGGKPLETATKADGRVFRFESYKPTWRVDVAAAKFRTVEDENRRIRVFVLPEDEAEARRILEAAQKSFRFYEGLLGELGDSPGYAVIEIPEGWGSQAGDFYMLLAAAAFRDKGRTSELYHEIAHNWDIQADGRIKRCRYFDEAFASYLQGLAIREFEGEEAFAKYMTRLREGFLKACRRDEKNGSTPIADYWREEKDENSYTKGAWSLFVLNQVIGETGFRSLLRDLRGESRVRGVDFAGFQAQSEKAASRKQDRFFREWIFGAESSRLLREGLDIKQIAARYR